MAVIDIVSIVVGVLVIGFMIAMCLIIEHKDKIKQRLYDVLLLLTTHVEEAETMFAQGQGDAKLKYVLSQVKVDCIEHKVKLTEEAIKSYIERILATPRKRLGNNTTQTQVVQNRPHTVQNNTIQGQQNKGV